MSRLKKIDLINDAYSLMRMSGITLQPSGDDITLALDRLEDMIAEFAGRNIHVSWNTEEIPDANTRHGMPLKFFTAVSANLSGRLLSDFGSDPHPSLVASIRSGFSLLSSHSAAENARETQYPARQPIGSGVNLRYNRYQRFYRPEPEAPVDTEGTVRMMVGDIDIIEESYNDWLWIGETLDSYEISIDKGVTVLESEMGIDKITAMIEADGRGQGRGNMAVVMRIKATTTNGRVQTRVKYFTVIELP